MRDRSNEGASWPTRLRQTPTQKPQCEPGDSILHPKPRIVNPARMDVLREAIFLLETNAARLLGQTWTAERSLSVDTADVVIDAIRGGIP